MGCDEVLDPVSPPNAVIARGSPPRYTVGDLIEVLVVDDDNDDFFLIDELLRSQFGAPRASAVGDSASEFGAPGSPPRRDSGPQVHTQHAASVDEAREVIARRAFDPPK